jgi:hypothetical protein
VRDRPRFTSFCATTTVAFRSLHSTLCKPLISTAAPLLTWRVMGQRLLARGLFDQPNPTELLLATRLASDLRRVERVTFGSAQRPVRSIRA